MSKKFDPGAISARVAGQRNRLTSGPKGHIYRDMKRRRLYIIYLGLWVLTAFILRSGFPKELAHHWAGQGSLALPLTVIYGLPIFLLYLFTVFLFDFRGESVNRGQVLLFLRRRRLAIVGFLFALAVLIHLILRTFAA